MRFLRIAFSAVLILGGLSVVPAPAVGQEAESEAQESQRYGIEEIVVTAERREKSVQDTPIAISAFSAAEIGRSDLDAIENIQFQVPGLVYAEVESYSQVTLRGVGLEVLATAGEPGVAFNIDGVYLPRSTTSNVILSDLERIEILRGPQGTLYGRNTAWGCDQPVDQGALGRVRRGYFGPLREREPFPDQGRDLLPHRRAAERPRGLRLGRARRLPKE